MLHHHIVHILYLCIYLLLMLQYSSHLFCRQQIVSRICCHLHLEGKLQRLSNERLIRPSKFMSALWVVKIRKQELLEALGCTLMQLEYCNKILKACQNLYFSLYPTHSETELFWVSFSCFLSSQDSDTFSVRSPFLSPSLSQTHIPSHRKFIILIWSFLSLKHPYPS